MTFSFLKRMVPSCRLVTSNMMNFSTFHHWCSMLLWLKQSIDEKAKRVACSSSRSCAKTYPVREDCGIIWVWPDSGPQATVQAERNPTPVSQGVAQRWNDPTKSKPSWYRRELPYSFDILIENLADPCEPSTRWWTCYLSLWCSWTCCINICTCCRVSWHDVWAWFAPMSSHFTMYEHDLLPCFPISLCMSMNCPYVISFSSLVHEVFKTSNVTQILFQEA
jgi:hypothetical protein